MLRFYKEHGVLPKIKQAKEIKETYDRKKLTLASLHTIMETSLQSKKLVFDYSDFAPFFPSGSSPKKMKEDIIKVLTHWKNNSKYYPLTTLPTSTKRRLVGAVKKSKLVGEIARTAQQTIPYEHMGQDGICRVYGNYFTKTVEFYDITYQLAQNEDKQAIFENYCDFLNYFDSGVRFQLSFVNRYGNTTELEQATTIPLMGDDFDSVREEYSTMLKNQLSKGNNGLLKSKYITFGIEADSRAVAKTRLERIETDIIANFKAMSVKSRVLNGYERLKLMFYSLRPIHKICSASIGIY